MRTTVTKDIAAVNTMRPVEKAAIDFIMSLKPDDLVDLEEIAKATGFSEGSFDKAGTIRVLNPYKYYHSKLGHTRYGQPKAIQKLREHFEKKGNHAEARI